MQFLELMKKLGLTSVVIQTETFTFYPNDGSPEVNIYSGFLRQWLHTNVQDKLITLEFPEQTLDELVVIHGLEQSRLQTMTVEEAVEPVIIGLYSNGEHMLIDGGHRRYYWAKRGFNRLRGWLVPEEVWREFCFDPDDTPGLHLDGGLLPQRKK